MERVLKEVALPVEEVVVDRAVVLHQPVDLTIDLEADTVKSPWEPHRLRLLAAAEAKAVGPEEMVEVVEEAHGAEQSLLAKAAPQDRLVVEVVVEAALDREVLGVVVELEPQAVVK